jgi:hypothetical protein
VFAFGAIELKDPGECVEDLLGRFGRTALFEAYVVVDAHARQVCDFFAT